jgi:protein tyrosine/serine phosphatase
MEEPAAAAAAAEKARAKAAMAQAMHPSPSAKHLSQLTNILNARDLAEASPKLKPGRLIRSGSPAHASLEDVLLLRRELHVQQLVDFRSTEEHKEDTAWSLMLSNGVIKTYDTYGAVVEVSVDHNAALHGVELQDIQLHRISLMERSRVVRGMMTKLPFSTLLWAGWYKLTGNRKEMHGVLMPEVNRGGLLLIYQILVDTSQADIAKALQVITTSLEEREPCMFFCKLGKDRTGLIAALVLAACGLSEDEIVADYVRSDGVHEVALGGIEKDSDLAGMDQAVFAAAPPEAMRGLMQYPKERYGGMRQYMEYIGFGREQQAALRRAMTDGDW